MNPSKPEIHSGEVEELRDGAGLGPPARRVNHSGMLGVSESSIKLPRWKSCACEEVTLLRASGKGGQDLGSRAWSKYCSRPVNPSGSLLRGYCL